MEQSEELSLTKNDLVEYITTIKSNFLTDDTIELFKIQIDNTTDVIELIKIRQSIIDQVETSQRLDNISKIQREKQLKNNKYTPDNPYFKS